MKLSVNPNVLNVKPYVPGKPIEEVKRELGLTQVIKLASNENPYPPSAKVIEAVSRAACDLNRYPDGGCFQLRTELGERLNVNPAQLIFGNGSDEVIVMAVRSFVNDGDEVIIADPSFLVYAIASTVEGAKIRKVPLVDLKYDLPGMLKEITDKTRMIFIGNPDNPAGTYVSSDALSSFMDNVPPCVAVFVDEAYFEYVDEADYPDTISMLKTYPNLIVSRTFSKMYGLAGLRVGYGIASTEVIDILNRVREPFNVNSLAQAGAMACLRDEEYYSKIRQEVKAERDFLNGEIRRLGFDPKESFTNFIMIGLGKAAAPVVDGLLKRGVIVRNMDVWGLENTIRVSIGTHEENQTFIKELGALK